MKSIAADAWFDGEGYHATPILLRIDRGRIVELREGGFADWNRATAAATTVPATTVPTAPPSTGEDGSTVHRCACLMPGLVEAHAHFFLDGGELDFAQRNRYLDSPPAAMLEIARANVRRTLARGITLARDAGDRFGVNHAIRAESKSLRVRSPGIALRRPKRYGAFMAREVSDLREALAAVHDIAAAGADDLKIIQTGIIDFESGSVKGAPQFELDELRTIVALAHELGLRSFAHCSGTEGIDVAVRAGVDSIEHGFFMTGEILLRMADQGTAWVPTFSPVHFQWQRPELAGWKAQTVAKLRAILDSHREHVALAARLGVHLVAGSDAGSPGVEHGAGLIAELNHFLDCGMTMAQALRAASSLPRRLWGVEPAQIRIGAAVDLTLFDADPFHDRANLARVGGVCVGEQNES